MKKFFILFSLIILGFSIKAQNTLARMEVLELKLIPNSTEASRAKKKDANGDKCALIKLTTPNFRDEADRDKLRFDSDRGTFLYPDKGVGEINLFLTEGCKTLIFKHPDYGVLTYSVPINLEGFKTYSMVIKVNDLAPVASQSIQLGSNYVDMNVTPSDAIITIDGKFYAKDNIKLTVDEPHELEVTHPLYHSYEQTIYASSKDKLSYDIKLSPAFGWLNIKSKPESGATVLINGRRVGTTPYKSDTLASGEYEVTLLKEMYENATKTVNVRDGVAGKNESVTVSHPTPIYGALDIVSTPTKASVYLDGTKIGKTPMIYNNVLIGSHTLSFDKSGCSSTQKTVNVVEGQIAEVSAKLEKVSDNRTFTVNGVTFEMVSVKGGTFTMGCTSEQGGDCDNDESPSHSVTLSDYYIGKFEVTQKLWKAVMGSNPSYFKGDDLPVEQVSWNDCKEFIGRLNQLTGANFRLPTEAEWEYADRGGANSRGYKYSGSNSIADVAWYWDNSGDKTHTVGTKTPNELGIYDMSGNVFEWCEDWYGGYSEESQINPEGPSSGSYRVLRGGSWSSYARYCRVSYRYYNISDYRLNSHGFRLALVH